MHIEDKGYKFSKAALAWQGYLREGGYEHHVYKKSDCKKLIKFCRVWRRIFKCINLSPYKRYDLSVFEVGCGGGKYLVQFILNGWRTVGIDCSKEVLDRASNYLEEILRFYKKPLNVKLIYEDFLNFNSSEKFDLVFHSGVIEHFLDKDDRIVFLKKMFELTKPGGYIISIVPNTIVYPLRNETKKNDLREYDDRVLDIDYTPNLMKQEFKYICGREIKILPHNLFVNLLFKGKNSILYLIRKLIYYILQLIPPSVLPFNFACRHAGSLIGIVKR